ncbi:MAG TPA: BON domain-containing protein [Blastocatellia bacterium]|nr:BON domain-containing protein [Blastocatellia bacterium]
MIRKIIAVVLLVLVIGVVAFVVMGYRLQMPRAAQGVIQQASDSATTGKVRAAFGLSKRLSAYDIKIDTRGGVVTLTGQVPSDVDKDLAASVAKDTTGVQQVDNQLQVEPGVKPSEASLREGARVADLEIRADLRERLAASEELKGQDIQVSVQDRVITLGGKVETPQQKAGAEQVARSLPNVANVVNNLAVGNPSAAQAEVPGVPAAATKDQELTKQVSFALFNERDNFKDVGAVKVTARDGTVTLSGTVASRAERALAERIARGVNGVHDVSNMLTTTLS